LEAARVLVARVGFDRMSMDEVARCAGVGKDTLYRRWPSKLALVRDGILRGAAEAVPLPESGDTRADLVGYLSGVVEYATGTSFGRIIAALVGEAFRNPDLAAAFREFAAYRRHAAGVLLLRALRSERAVIPDDCELERELDLMFAQLYYRLLVTGEELDQTFVESIVNRSLGPGGTAPNGREG
jgi:AcrR family transcriptional regulator